MEKIGIIANTQKSGYAELVGKAVEYIGGRAEIYMAGDRGAFENIHYVSNEELYKTVSTMLVIGGDGTIICSATGCARNGIKVLGINFGRIGFMTEIEPDYLENAIECLINGQYKTEKRIMIKAQIKRNGEVVSTCHALNDIVVSKAAGVKLVGIELYADSELVNRYIADGLILATPTGSTGYSISAGGPVADPGMDLFLATPICAHMLSVRSAILPSDKEIIVRQDRDYGDYRSIVTADGEVQGEIGNDDEIIISKSQYKLELIKIGNQSFYDTLLKKLS